MNIQRILLVDDDIEALRLVGMTLERKGYEIVAASSGRQAMEKALQEKPALVILDLMMPDLDGYQVATQLRRHPATTNIPILMFTAKTSIPDKVAGFQAGADDYLTKPIHPHELVDHVQKLLQNHTPSKELVINKNVICFLPTKGGIGTSTLILHTAIELKRQQPDVRVVLVELQNCNATLSLYLGMSMRNYLQPLAEQPLASVNEETVGNAIVAHASGVDLLLSSANPTDSEKSLSRDFVRSLFYYLGLKYDYIFVDLPIGLNESNSEALTLSKHILLTIEPNPVGMAVAQKVLDGFQVREITVQKTSLVIIYRMPTSSALKAHTIESNLRRPVVGSIPFEPEMAFQSIQSNRPMKLQPHSSISQQIRLVVQSIVDES